LVFFGHNSVLLHIHIHRLPRVALGEDHFFHVHALAHGLMGTALVLTSIGGVVGFDGKCDGFSDLISEKG